MYSRDEVKALTDKVLNMTRAQAAEVEFSGGERSATRFANSNITANMVQFDQNLTLTDTEDAGRGGVRVSGVGPSALDRALITRGWPTITNS